MDLADLATPADFRKLQTLRDAFAGTLRAINAMTLPCGIKREATTIIRAAANAAIFNGEPTPIVRKYYAFDGDFKTVWFSLDLFTVMPDCRMTRTLADRRETVFIIKNIMGLLLNEVRPGLRDDVGI